MEIQTTTPDRLSTAESADYTPSTEMPDITTSSTSSATPDRLSTAESTYQTSSTETSKIRPSSTSSTTPDRPSTTESVDYTSSTEMPDIMTSSTSGTSGTTMTTAQSTSHTLYEDSTTMEIQTSTTSTESSFESTTTFSTSTTSPPSMKTAEVSTTNTKREPTSTQASQLSTTTTTNTTMSVNPIEIQTEFTSHTSATTSKSEVTKTTVPINWILTNHSTTIGSTTRSPTNPTTASNERGTTESQLEITSNGITSSTTRTTQTTKHASIITNSIPMDKTKTSESIAKMTTETPIDIHQHLINRTTRQSTDSSTAITTSIATTTPDPRCQIDCPSGYLQGTRDCFFFAPKELSISYQSAISYCRIQPHSDLIYIDRLRDINNIHILQQYSVVNDLNWFYANGGGSKAERTDRSIAIFDVFQMFQSSTNIVRTVGVSEKFSNISAVCVQPRFCDPPLCNLGLIIEIEELDDKLIPAKKLISSKESTTVTCKYTMEKTTVSCGTRGALIPHPTQITCEPQTDELLIGDNTGDAVASCSMCFGRGTSECIPLNKTDPATMYQCKCKEDYTLRTCWYTKKLCRPDSCGERGTCVETNGNIKCECEWGYQGSRCDDPRDPAEKKPNAEFLTRLWDSVDGTFMNGVQLTLGTVFTMSAKILGKVVISNDEDDPQETHQSLRAILQTIATTSAMLFHNPYLFMIPTATCRTYFLIIHFLFIYTLTQWMFEGFNANQVLRCRHINEWEIGYDGRRDIGIMAVPRLVISCIIVLTVLISIYQGGWYQLVSSWTCIGVICKSTSSMWIPILFTIMCLLLMATAVFENSVRIIFRRPLLDLAIRQRIELEEGIIRGQNIEKCRRNPVYCFVGIMLLAATWILTILSSDKDDNKLLGLIAILFTGIYTLFSCIQGLVTCPSTYSTVIHFLMRKLPERIAPNYEEMKMWTRDEIKEVYKLPKEERKKMIEEHLPRNARRYLQYKWDHQLAKKLTNETISIDEAIIQILREQIDKIEENDGSEYQREQILETFVDWANKEDVHNFDRQLAAIHASHETVQVCGVNNDGTTVTNSFFINPHFGKFEPIVGEALTNPEHLDIEELENKEYEKHRRNTNVVKVGVRSTSHYQIIRSECEAQSNFIRSAIHFK
ncbi:unnamed protein product [Caenorhabditis bovis]|uniref:EGF-like domain-containing protein n=1 Tax=Caenorhabditis bovis TaxID=2654633 RepID=A0A8S1EWV8_9PELO|nr:unnamed protein product [Caenorhabditis bovis]